MKKLSPLVVLLVVLGCGDNLQSPTPVTSLSAPANLRAFSVSQSSVKVQWSAPSGVSDSTFQGYIAEVGSFRDTIDKSQLAFVVNGLPSGESTFSIYSLKIDGLRSDAATVRWAPASRFDSVYTVYESSSPVSTRPEGFNVGTATSNPTVMIMNLNDQAVQQTMDFFLNGDSTETRQSLSLWSANLRVGTMNRTVFSTQTDASPGLDFPLQAFPAEDTFVKDSIAVLDNMIYYARVVGDPQQINYVRVHLHIRTGTVIPNRIIEVRVSLQRVPGLLYALDESDYSKALSSGYYRAHSFNLTIHNQRGAT